MKKSTAQVLSFISGLTLAAVVVGVTISKSPALRSEIESQLNSLLKTTRSLVDTYKNLSSKSKTAVKFIKSDTFDSSMEELVEQERAQSQIDNQWDLLEAATEYK